MPFIGLFRYLKICVLCFMAAISPYIAATAEEAEKPEELKSLTETVAGYEKQQGLFNIYRDPKTGSVCMELGSEQLDREYIYFNYAENGVVDGNNFRGAYRNEGILRLERYYDRIEFIKVNTLFYFDPHSALSRAADANISEARLAATKIVATSDDGKRFLINMDGVLLKEALHPVNFLPNPEKKPHEQFALGQLSEDRSRYAEIRSYPDNIDFVVDYVYDNKAPYVAGGDDITDARSVTVRYQHTFIKMPENNYVPRRDDARVGYFSDRITDLTSHSSVPYRDLIQRWHLEKKNPEAALSEPVTPIVWWLENTTPLPYREHIANGVLAWNQAFEKAGFKNAIEVRQQPDDADWKAGDIRHNVIRWTSSPNPPFGGYGPRFTNPRTGQIIGADIMMEDVYAKNIARRPPIYAPGPEQPVLESELGNLSVCSAGFSMADGAALARIGLTAAAADTELEKLLEQSLVRLALHEVGHTLGLLHNMKGTQLHGRDQVYDASVTQGVLSASVMDYPAINFAPPGIEQGDYYDTRPGPYDVWAIQFGYAPDLEGDRRVAHLARSSERELGFGNDADDMRAPGSAIDPRINVNDMSADAITYATDRFTLVRSLLADLREKMTIPGESWAELRNAFAVVSRDYHRQAVVVSRYIGGVYVERAWAGEGPPGSQPYTPVPEERQREAMRVLGDAVFAPNAFEVPEDLVTHLGEQRRGFDLYGKTEDPKLHARALATQKDVLDHLLHPVVMTRISDTMLYGNTYSLNEVLSDLTDAIFASDLKGEMNSFRQNLQVEYVTRMLAIASDKEGSPYDYSARAVALFELERIESWMKRYGKSKSGSAAHAARNYVLHLIEKGLDRKA